MRSPRDLVPVRRASGAEPGGPPDFVGVGALGSGTGWWHGMLLAHPEIRAPRAHRRALHFFDKDVAKFRQLSQTLKL